MSYPHSPFLQCSSIPVGMHGWPTLRSSRCFRRDLGDKLATRVRKKKTSKIAGLLVGPPGLEPGNQLGNASKISSLRYTEPPWRQLGDKPDRKEKLEAF